MNPKDDFHVQVSGSLIAMRIVLAAILKTHPEPRKVLQAVNDLLKLPGALDGQLPEPIQAVLDERLQELLSHLHKRIQ